MAVNKKGMRKVNYNGRQYLWRMEDVTRKISEDGGGVVPTLVQPVKERWLHIIDNKKKFIVHYRLPNAGDEFALLKVEGAQFPRQPNGKEIHVPRWKHDGKRYPTADFVRRLIQWCMEKGD